MKKLSYIGVSLVFILSILFSIKNNNVLVEVAIIDSCGDQIWPLNETLPSSNPCYHKATKSSSGYNLQINNEVYLSFLQNNNAELIRVWEQSDKSKHADFEIGFYQKNTIKNKEVKKSKRSKKYAQKMTKLGKDIKADKATMPTGRNNLRLQQKGGSFDIKNAYQAHKKVKGLVKEKKQNPESRDAGLRKWKSLGPGNIGGRIRTIAAHPTNPDIILVGSVSGGIWKTINGGSTWSNVSDFLPNMAVSQILYNPDSPNIVYAATGEAFQMGSAGNTTIGQGSAAPGIGVLKSYDGGDTWTLLPQPQFYKWIGAMSLDPNNSNHIFIGAAQTNVNNLLLGQSYDGRIIKSEDGGNTWVMSASVIATIPLSITIREENSNFVYVGCANNAYRSTNATSAGNLTTFQEITDDPNELPINPGRVEIALAPNSPNKLYASIAKNGGEVWVSLDDGQTWAKQNVVPFNYLGTIGWYANTIWVDPLDSDKLVVGGLDLWRSIDGGLTLSKISDWKDASHLTDIDEDGNIANSIHADQHRIIVASDYSASNRKVYIGNDGGIYSTNNISTATQNTGWINLNNKLQVTQFYGGAVSKDGSFIVGGAQDNSFISNDLGGGQIWDMTTTGDGAYAAVSPDDEDIAYANVNNNRIMKTTDGGGEWVTIARFGGNNLSSCANDNLGCVTYFPTKFEVQDNSPLLGRFVMDKNDPDILYVGADRLWKNDNAGDAGSWEVINSSVSPGSYVTIETGSNSNIVWTGTNIGNLQKSANGGNSWTSISLPSAFFTRFVTDIAVSPDTDNKVVVTEGSYADDNIWLTTDAGSNWTNISLGFNMQVNTVTWHPTKENWLYVGTDFGIFASENNGVDWSIMPVEDESEGPYNGEISELFWSGDGTPDFPHYLHAATFGRGMWRTLAPLRDKIYVDRLYTGDSNGSFQKPYKSAYAGFNAAGSGSEVIFLSGGTHDPAASSIILDRKVIITLENGGASVIIK